MKEVSAIALGWGQWEKSTTKGHAESFGGDESGLYIIVAVISWVYTISQTNQNVHFKWSQFIVRKWFLSKTDQTVASYSPLEGRPHADQGWSVWGNGSKNQNVRDVLSGLSDKPYERGWIKDRASSLQAELGGNAFQRVVLSAWDLRSLLIDWEPDNLGVYRLRKLTTSEAPIPVICKDGCEPAS